MKMLTLLMSFMVLNACAIKSVRKDPVAPKAIPIVDDRQFDPYIQLFKTEALLRGVYLDYPRKLDFYIVKNLFSVYNGAVGFCLQQSDTLVVAVDKAYWDRADYVRREILLFHELGHCILKRGHDSTTDELGRPRSLMYPAVLNSLLYFSHREYYLNELFYNTELP